MANLFSKKRTASFRIEKGWTSRQYFVYGASVVVFLIIGFYAYRILFLKDFAAQSKSQIYSQLEEARAALRDLDPAGARQPLATIDDGIRLIQDEANKYGILTLATFWGKLSDKIQAIPATLQNLAGISGTAIHLNEDIAFLKENAAQLMINKRGPELLERLGQFRGKLSRLTEYVDELDRTHSSFDEGAMKSLASLRAEIGKSSEALDSVTTLLSSPTPQHILILFQNPTEMRPGGGFLGSYAHIELQQGNIGKIEIRDIYDPDGQLDQRLVPPEPLQQITKDWEARDANWFFDYPTSAKKAVRFLNKSKIYQEAGVTFNTAIALNTNVMKDMLTIVGPIEVPQYKMTVTPENFLSQLQREVEAGPDKAINQPKRILKVLSPLIIEQLTTLDDAEKRGFIQMLERHLSLRNIMLFFEDRGLQRYAHNAGIAGDILAASPNVIGEYLAVVNANIGGGKSDAFVSQKIYFKSSIDETGVISNSLTVIRKHTGAKQKDWWYRAANKNYMQVYTPLGTRLTGSTGRSMWPKTPVRDYKKYAKDADLEAIAATNRYIEDLGIDRTIVSEKTVFASWVNTAAGATSQYTLDYTNPRRLNPESSIPYEFVFEKQSGASTTLSVSISAPPKYKWKEINKAVIEYETDEPAGRIRIRQTLTPTGSN